MPESAPGSPAPPLGDHFCRVPTALEQPGAAPHTALACPLRIGRDKTSQGNSRPKVKLISDGLETPTRLPGGLRRWGSCHATTTPSQFCPRGFDVHPSISSVAPSKDPTSSPLLREVGEDQSPLLQRQFVLLLPRLLQQLPPHNSEDGAQQRPPEHLGRLVPRQAVAELGHVAITQPPARRRPQHQRQHQRPRAPPRGTHTTLLDTITLSGRPGLQTRRGSAISGSDAGSPCQSPRAQLY